MHTSHSKKFLDLDIVKEIAAEFNIGEAFVEKDWHAVRLLELISQFKHDKNLNIIFGGGTSLSKGYKIIKRFSEDLDFIIELNEETELSAGQKRAFRKAIVDMIIKDGQFEIDPGDVQKYNNHNSFKIPIQYAMHFPNEGLRPYLQLEMTFSKIALPYKECSISSIVSRIMKNPPDLTFRCISEIETAANKLSALTWRVLDRNRDHENDDPALIRHLHDLAILEPMIHENKKDFIDTALQSLSKDQNREKNHSHLTISEKLEKAVKILREDRLYSEEYKNFVSNMSYEQNHKIIPFENALLIFERIVNLTKNHI